jgi:short-subunit dehydrogenase
MNFKDKVVVITGASKGLGKALAEEFSKEGAILALNARQEFDLNLPEAHYFTGDVSNEENVERISQEVIQKLGKIDVWINNAGIWLPPVPFEEVPSNRITQLFQVNVLGTIYGSKAAAVQMKKQNSGLILQIISTSALEGRNGQAVYCATKYAVDGFSKSIRKELEPFNIRVYSVFPGGMKTALFNEEIPAEYEQYMDPQEVAQKILDNLKQDNPEEELILRRPKQ